MSRVPKKVIDWWRSKLANEKQRLADIEAGRVSVDESTVRYLKRTIPRLEAVVENAERQIDAHRA